MRVGKLKAGQAVLREEKYVNLEVTSILHILILLLLIIIVINEIIIVTITTTTTTTIIIIAASLRKVAIKSLHHNFLSSLFTSFSAASAAIN